MKSPNLFERTSPPFEIQKATNIFNSILVSSKNEAKSSLTKLSPGSSLKTGYDLGFNMAGFATAFDGKEYFERNIRA